MIDPHYEADHPDLNRSAREPSLAAIARAQERTAAALEVIAEQLRTIHQMLERGFDEDSSRWRTD